MVDIKIKVQDVFWAMCEDLEAPTDMGLSLMELFLKANEYPMFSYLRWNGLMRYLPC